MCVGCQTRTQDNFGRCPDCDGHIIDARHCPRQITCGDCDKVFYISQWYTQITYVDEDLVVWGVKGHTWYEDPTVYRYLDQLTKPYG